MRLIDEMAMHAMQGLLANSNIDSSNQWIAQTAYDIAEAMIKEAKGRV